MATERLSEKHLATVEPKKQEELFVQWLKDVTGVEIDAKSAILARKLASKFQQSDENKEYRAANSEARQKAASEAKERGRGRPKKDEPAKAPVSGSVPAPAAANSSATKVGPTGPATPPKPPAPAGSPGFSNAAKQ